MDICCFDYNKLLNHIAFGAEIPLNFIALPNFNSLKPVLVSSYAPKTYPNLFIIFINFYSNY